MTIDDLVGGASPLGRDDIAAAATLLGVTPAHVAAVVQVESRGVGFDAQTRRPIILFEPHVFHRRTAGAFDAIEPRLSYAQWGAKPYPKTQVGQYERLAAALKLAEAAALESTSWGLFQIMGYNWKLAGALSVGSFVRCMARSERDQLNAFAIFVRAQPGMHDALRAGDWAGFARAYNGPGYAKNSYDRKLKAAFDKYRAASPAG